ncbi:hypothetical protein WSK_0535 [Novosphingobium sp. Rr 2-17]|uniref:energy transducer TonB n=1 Tax=Novosphingobium sp. Rr 2-17 TaxID=555793 RepID=UPI000269A177|nr:ankyrin repeat domain-containing protein [Novosphingobium sp. Rr 2-17]EIZ80853.1 hypothetical protein WSK_0535 [Novosphingobium sp. Rr 2-17]
MMRFGHSFGTVVRGRRFAASLLCVALVSLAACKEEPAGSVMVEGESLAACGDQRADQARLKALRKSDDRLRRLLAASEANAITEAYRALDAGDFRLAAATTAEGINTEAYGVQCRVLGGLQPWTVRALAFLPPGAVPTSNDLASGATGFGRRYNAVLLADKRYPYADVCRPIDKAGAKPETAPDTDAGVDQPYGFVQLGTARMAHGLGAAARRGSVSDIGTLISRDKQDVNAPDLFGLTPLAWAIAYHRWPAAQALLRAKASPIGAACQSAIDRESPLQVARVMRWNGVIRAMRPLVTEEQFASLRQKPRWQDASLNEFNHAFSELKERYEDELSRQRFAKHEMNFDVDTDGAITSCRMDPGSESPAFDKELCGLAVEIVRWTPARDAFGTRVPETAKLVVGFGGAN